MEPTSIILAGEVTDWIDDQTNWLAGALPVIFLTVVFAFGVYLMVVTRGGIRKLILFGIGAAVVYMVLTNVDAIGGMFSTELDPNGAPAPGSQHVVVADDDRVV